MTGQADELAGSVSTATMPTLTDPQTIPRWSSPTDLHSTTTPFTMANEASSPNKSRLNSEIINFFKTPPISNANPSIQGIGLYTHIAAPTNPSTGPGSETPPHPVFLPTTQNPAGKEPSNSTLPEEIHKLCSDLRDVIRDEEAAVAKHALSLDQLTKRYAGLPIPSDSTALVVHEKGDVVMREDGVGQQGMEREVGMQSGSRRPSADVAGSVDREDVSVQGAEEETAKKLPPGTHIYREDPRRRR